MSFAPLSPMLLQVPPKALLILIAIVSSHAQSTATLQGMVSDPNRSIVSGVYNSGGDRSVSDSDARHRFVANARYGLPLDGTRFVESWQLADHQFPFSDWRISLVETSAVRCESQPLRTICVFPNTRE